MELYFYDIKGKLRYTVEIHGCEDKYYDQINNGYIYFYDFNKKIMTYISFAQYARVDIVGGYY